MKKTKRKKARRPTSRNALLFLGTVLIIALFVASRLSEARRGRVLSDDGAPIAYTPSDTVQNSENGTSEGESDGEHASDGDSETESTPQSERENKDEEAEMRTNVETPSVPTVPNISDEPTEPSKPSEPSEPSESSESSESSEPSVPTFAVSEKKPESIVLTTYNVTLSVGNSFMPIVTMSPADASDKSEIWVTSDAAVATVNGYGRITGNAAGTCTVTVSAKANPSVFATVSVTVNERVEPELTYINGILIANKSYPLPSDYNPGVDPTAQSALNDMIAAAKNDGLTLWLRSGFRSYETQKTLYNGYARRDGTAAADRYSARPGYSEHQTGLAFDLNSLSQSFADTAEGKWIAEHCYEYGFIIRYPKDKESVTGYMYEPWHVRYLGTETAKSVYESGLTLEEYLGITSVYAD